MARIYNDITETIGNTPLVRLNRTAKKHGALADILLKLEFFNPLASVKDRIGVAMIDDALGSGRINQDSVLIDVETGAATGFTGSSAAFFALVLSHTHQGTFGDPYYGGNANFVGWDLIAYPGVRTMVTAGEQQQLEKHTLKPNHKSAYETDMFTKATGEA